MLFKDIVGQTALKKQLRRMRQEGRVAHAQLFVGPEGCGALPLALAYSQYLQCENPSPEEACGQCSACRKMGKYSHPDYHFAFPTIGTGKISNDFLKEWREALTEYPYLELNAWLQRIGAENQQGNINKNECQEIIRKLSYTKAEGQYKILILWLPEYLGKEGNRLLKLIEEPQPDTVFLLVAEQADKILNTILSRCQLTQVPRLEDSEIQEALEARGLPGEQAARLSAWAEGNWNAALRLHEELGGANTSHSERLLDWLRLCYKGKGHELVQWVEQATSGETKMGRKDLLFFFRQALFFFRECLWQQYGQKPGKLSPNEQKAAQWLAGQIQLPQYQALAQCLDEQAYYVERNAHPKILLLETCIRMHKILRGENNLSGN